MIRKESQDGEPSSSGTESGEFVAASFPGAEHQVGSTPYPEG
jgi:hypothetical protein